MAYYRSRPTRVGFLFCKLDTPTITNTAITNTVPFGENGKGTVKIARQRAQATVPFAKKRQKHGRNWRLWGVADRAFWKKATKARSKLRGKGRSRPCLLQKSGKGTVKIGGCGAQATVPFAKKRQRHGRNRGLWGVGDRAFCKKWSKARSKSEVVGHRRPCLLQKMVKGTVEIGGCGAQVTVPFAKKRQRHGRNREAKGVADRAFGKKATKARSKLEINGHRRPRIGAFGAGRSRPDGRRLVNKKAAPHGSAPYIPP